MKSLLSSNWVMSAGLFSRYTNRMGMACGMQSAGYFLVLGLIITFHFTLSSLSEPASCRLFLFS